MLSITYFLKILFCIISPVRELLFRIYFVDAVGKNSLSEAISFIASSAASNTILILGSKKLSGIENRGLRSGNDARGTVSASKPMK